MYLIHFVKPLAQQLTIDRDEVMRTSQSMQSAEGAVAEHMLN